jgi:hypothetical protein
MNRLVVTWLDAKREPQNPADPRYPDGIDIDMTSGATKWCNTALPYPAKRCGSYLIECRICRMTVVVTTAGRADDPRSVKIACKQRWN